VRSPLFELRIPVDNIFCRNPSLWVYRLLCIAILTGFMISSASISPSSSQTSNLSNTSDISSSFVVHKSKLRNPLSSSLSADDAFVVIVSYPLAVLSPSSSSFSKLAQGGVFVDKSFALVEFLREVVPVHLLLRPRRSGKTTLLDMFR